jgi:hypothetical protein
VTGDEDVAAGFDAVDVAGAALALFCSSWYLLRISSTSLRMASISYMRAIGVNAR